VDVCKHQILRESLRIENNRNEAAEQQILQKITACYKMATKQATSDPEEAAQGRTRARTGDSRSKHPRPFKISRANHYAIQPDFLASAPRIDLSFWNSGKQGRSSVHTKGRHSSNDEVRAAQKGHWHFHY
jgi:hypothetical protein